MSHAAGIYSMTLDATMSSVVSIFACGDEDTNNNYAYVISDSPTTSINKIDMTTGVETSQVSIAFANHCAAGPSFNYVVITGDSVLYIRLKTDLSDVGTATRSMTTSWTGILTLDNLNTGMLYYFTTTYELAKADLNTATATDVTETMVWSVGAAYGDLDRPLNFGPYQYVVTLTVWSTSAYALAIDKTTNTPPVAASFATGNAMMYATSTVAGPMIDYGAIQVDAYITGIANSDNNNVQSYYLTVDRCVTRSALICTDCVAPYYRVGTLANNLCQTPAEFAASKFGIESNVTRLANICTDINCNDCRYNKDACITCNTAWYLDTTIGQCRQTTIAPPIGNRYDKFRSNQCLPTCPLPRLQS